MSTPEEALPGAPSDAEPALAAHVPSVGEREGGYAEEASSAELTDLSSEPQEGLLIEIGGAGGPLDGEGEGGHVEEASAVDLLTTLSSEPQEGLLIEIEVAGQPSTQSKKKAYVYDYQSPNPGIRERFKKEITSSALEKQVPDAEPIVDAVGDSTEAKAKSLNPKLTRRAYVYNYEPPRPDLREDTVRQLREGPPSPTESDMDDDEAPATLSVEEQQPPPVPRAVAALDPAQRQMLLHTGGWQTPEYTAGKLNKGTGLWLCCGSREQFSLYCTSMAQREKFQRDLSSHAAAAEQAIVYSKMVEQERRGPWERQEIAAVEQEEEDEEEALMQRANSEESTLNGPMLISWTHKNCASHRTSASGRASSHSS